MAASNPFTPVYPSVNLTATVTSKTVALPNSTNPAQDVRIHNGGTATAFVAFGTASRVITAASAMAIPSGAVEMFTRSIVSPVLHTHLCAITSTGTAALNVTVGEGC